MIACGCVSRHISIVELVLVIVVSLAVLVPGIGSYSLVDPWETHYGEVSREMLQNHDLVHTTWVGGQGPTANEGFRSKPVLTMWLTTAGLAAFGVAKDGGYSGEIVASDRTMTAIRLPIVVTAAFGLFSMWLMLAKLVSRRVAWLALLVVGSAPMFCLISRQGIPDMPHCAFVIGALAMFVLAIEDGERPAGRHVALVFGLTGAFVGVQLIYYALYFWFSPQLAVPRFPSPVVVFPLVMGVLFAGVWRCGWLLQRLVPLVYLIRLTARPFVGSWRATSDVAEHLLRMRELTTMRQVYMLWCYALLGLAILAKGPPGLVVVGVIGLVYVVMFGRWRALYEGAFELKRGVLLMTVVFLPWHIAMFLKEGPLFISEYLYTHILSRAGADPDKSLGTFEYYTSQLGHGMWLWAALVPAALAIAIVRARSDTREGRVRMLVVLWAVCGFAVFGIVQTKFHHYILPVVPALGILVAFFLDDLLAHRERLHPIYAALGIGIVLLIARDLAWEPDRWIEMFMFGYNRPWPSGEPWSIDPSDGFVALGACGAVALALTAAWRRAGVVALAVVGFAICVWSLHAYMPVAGTHWGMREAMRSYYIQRTIYGEKRIYFGGGELWDDLHGAPTTFELDTLIPEALQVGQPMAMTIQLNKPAGDPLVMERQVVLAGSVHLDHRSHRDAVDHAGGARSARRVHRAGPRHRSAGPRTRALPRRGSPDRIPAVLARRELLVGRRDLRLGTRDQDRLRRYRVDDRVRQVHQRSLAHAAGPALLRDPRHRPRRDPQVAAADAPCPRIVRGRRYDVEQVLPDFVRPVALDCERADPSRLCVRARAQPPRGDLVDPADGRRHGVPADLG